MHNITIFNLCVFHHTKAGLFFFLNASPLPKPFPHYHPHFQRALGPELTQVREMGKGL